MTTYVLIDFENVQPTSFDGLPHAALRLLIFVGQNQTKVPISTASALQKLGSNVEYIQASGSGKNALDFHIAYYIGRLSAVEPSAMFYIVSEDKGFGPLCQHLLANNVAVTRISDVADIHLTSSESCDSNDAPYLRAREWLVTTKATLPRTKKTLASTISSVLKNEFPTERIQTIIQLLAGQGFLAIDGDKVTYMKRMH